MCRYVEWREKGKTAVSVIMPIYNPGVYLEEALGSLQHQTFRNFELICVDDGSKDPVALEILEKYESIFPQMKVLHQKENRGAAEARNAGFEKAVGKYVIFLDADDRFSPELLEKLYECVIRSDADVCVCGSEWLRADGQKEAAVPCVDKTEEGWLLNVRNVPWNRLVRSCYLREHQIAFQNLPSCNDVYYAVLTLMETERIAVCREILVTYRCETQNQISARRDPENRYEAIVQIIVRMKQRGKEDILGEILLYLMETSFYEYACCEKEAQKKSCYEKIQQLLRRYAERISYKDEFHAYCLHNYLTKPYEECWYADWHEMKLQAYMGKIRLQLQGRKKILLWGLGERGRAFLRVCAAEGLRISWVTDRSGCILPADRLCGAEYVTPQEALKRADCIVASNDAVAKEIRERGYKKRLIALEQFC